VYNNPRVFTNCICHYYIAHDLNCAEFARLTAQLVLCCIGIRCFTNWTETVARQEMSMATSAAQSPKMSVIYCPMPFLPASYSTCCLNAADELHCCYTQDSTAVAQSSALRYAQDENDENPDDSLNVFPLFFL
jgi:hypothetical protein